MNNRTTSDIVFATIYVEVMNQSITQSQAQPRAIIKHEVLSRVWGKIWKDVRDKIYVQILDYEDDR